MSSSTLDQLVLVANARMPSVRAQSLQVAQVAAAFSRAGVKTTLLHALRHPTPSLPEGQDLFDYYAVPTERRPDVVALPNIDWIDRVPTRAQFIPARIQELSFGRKAARWIRKTKPNAWVLSRELETARNLVKGKAKQPVFLEIHRVPAGALRRKWLLEAAQKSGGVVAISGGVREDLIELGIAADSIVVEHDAVEASRFANSPSKAEARSSLNIPLDQPVVVYTGGLMMWKGVDILVAAARRLPNYRFVIAGGMPSDLERIQAQTLDLNNLRLDGFQAPEKVALYLAAGDLGVVPNRSTPAISAKYTSPLKAFESMAAGLPLVASDLPALREILIGDDHAVFVAPDSDQALAEGIERLMNDSELRSRMAQCGRERVAETTWDARAVRLIKWMEARA
ncbi:MAG: glycosyltransferase involved in cell wall biosynthesis [Planctomycetota bacterium]|jgi:glycosyltransferase involved in cell wall biosynthesis